MYVIPLTRTIPERVGNGYDDALYRSTFTYLLDVGGCVKIGVILCRALSEKSMDSIGGISYFLNKSCYQTRCFNDNIICVSATQLVHSPAHGTRNTVQQLLRKKLSFVFF